MGHGRVMGLIVRTSFTWRS